MQTSGIGYQSYGRKHTRVILHCLRLKDKRRNIVEHRARESRYQMVLPHMCIYLHTKIHAECYEQYLAYYTRES